MPVKVILDSVSAIKTICGQQKKSDSCSYRLTRHCVEAECDGGRLLFHTLTGMLILIETDADLDEYRDMLIQNWFFVPTEFNEAVFADNVLKIARMLYEKKHNNKIKKHFTVLTSTDCNARCYYCYEVGIKRYSMSSDTAIAVGDYISHSSGGNEAELRWFGGEPLINSEAIDLICNRLLANGVRYKSLMISNGYYLDRLTIEKAIKLWNLKKVQITLDGTKETYNRVKAYVNDDGDAYNRVIQNIENALDSGIEVHIRLNTDTKNADEMMRLADELAMRFRGKKNLVVYPAVLFNFKNTQNRIESENQIRKSLFEINEKLKANGFDRKVAPLTRELKSNNCRADNDSCEIILPDGRLCKCGHKLENDSYGSIYTEERDIKNIESWKESIKFPECFTCSLYPRCINLKKCVWIQDNCSKTKQTILIKTLKQQIIDAYNERRD